MDAENRDWGRANPVDYVPVVGLLYRSYWCMVARRGQRLGSDAASWRDAARAERGRLFVAAGFTVALIVFFALGGVRGDFEPALVSSVIVALSVVFVHRLLSLVRVF